VKKFPKGGNNCNLISCAIHQRQNNAMLMTLLKQCRINKMKTYSDLHYYVMLRLASFIVYKLAQARTWDDWWGLASSSKQLGYWTRLRIKCSIAAAILYSKESRI